MAQQFVTLKYDEDDVELKIKKPHKIKSKDDKGCFSFRDLSVDNKVDVQWTDICWHPPTIIGTNLLTCCLLKYDDKATILWADRLNPATIIDTSVNRENIRNVLIAFYVG